MSQDFTPTPTGTDPPSLFAQALAGFMRHGLTYAAGMLAANGIIQQDQQAQVVSLGVSLGMAVAAYAWSYIQKRNTHK